MSRKYDPGTQRRWPERTHALHKARAFARQGEQLWAEKWMEVAGLISPVTEWERKRIEHLLERAANRRGSV